MLFPPLKNVAIASAHLLLASLATSAVCSFEAPALVCGLRAEESRNQKYLNLLDQWQILAMVHKLEKKCATNSCKAKNMFFLVSKLVEEISQWDKMTQGYKRDTKRYRKSHYHV